MNRIVRITGLLVVPMLAAMSAQAQVSFGPRIGLNLSNTNYDYSDVDFKDKPVSNLLPGAQIGLALNAQFGKLALQPALLFSMKGNTSKVDVATSSSTYKAKSSVRLNYAELPLNLVYSLKGADGGFQVFVGPYVALGLNGKVKVEEVETQNGVIQRDDWEPEIVFASEAGSDLNKAYVRSLDYGLNAGVGYKVDAIQVQVGYGLGLANRVPKYEGERPDIKVHNGNFQLALTYLFE
ncbi:porin family protein [Hymenobacter sp. YC55]|uniref:porin family protein n=1 Tax=Hymenobacter sp. YC55 TaxID=3034019 RepID=UPI0023F7A1C7|nr:porin family protein [Hymenobacter sp. YC55]MDF7810904.1 porin family protein [Hymenobacter sp. YC55]